MFRIFTKLFLNRQISGAKNFKAAKSTYYRVCYGSNGALCWYLIFSRNSKLSSGLDDSRGCLHSPGFRLWCETCADPDCSCTNAPSTGLNCEMWPRECHVLCCQGLKTRLHKMVKLQLPPMLEHNKDAMKLLLCYRCCFAQMHSSCIAKVPLIIILNLLLVYPAGL